MLELPGRTQDHHVGWKNPCTAMEKAEDDESQTGEGLKAVVSGEGGTLHAASTSEKVNNPVLLSKFPLVREQACIPIS